MKDKLENRRDFLGQLAMGALSVPFLLSCRGSSSAQIKQETDVLKAIRKNAGDPNANWTGASEFPRDVTSKASLASKMEPGDRLKITGTVFKQDGKSPAKDVLIYTYHTDTSGLYGQNGEPSHGRFRGWLLTDNLGRYEFTTVKPGSYPNRRNPAHIHMTLTTADRREFWIDSILFEGDPLITPDLRRIKRGGFDPVLNPTLDKDGVLQAVRNIRL